MRYLSILLLLGVTLKVNAQQINPVPDYIFRNQMSVGRNAPTDTAAYMSIGPRYGAVKGFMPPMVVDTNAVTGTKRNGLLIFSVQLNNFAYWDSTTSRFRQITAQATVDSLVFATRAWRKKGDDSLGAVIAVKTDTALLSTKAYRQKAVDSLVTLISTLGGGTVLSVGSGYGTNFSTITTTGSVVVDSLVITSRASRDKLKDSLQANIAGKVNISDTSTMLGAYLRKADTTAMLTPYLRKGDTTAMLSPYVRTAGFGLTKGTQTLSVDSSTIATRARVQKGIDSVASLVAAPDSLLFSTRAWRQKGDDSLAAIIATKATATGTTNYLSKFTGTSSLGNSIVYASTNQVGISTPSPAAKLHIVEIAEAEGLRVDGASGAFALVVEAGTKNITHLRSGLTIGSNYGGETPQNNGALIEGFVGIATDSATQELDVNGRARIRTIDSTASPINFLTTDKDGVIRKTTPFTGTVSSVATGFGLSGGTITTTGTLVADTNSMATRARVQKAVDSLNVNIATKGSGTVTSVAAGTGMSFTTITSTGSVNADTVALSTRAWRQKGIDSVAGLSRIGGSGTINRVPKFTASGTLGNGSIDDSSSSVRMTILSGGNIGIATAAPDYNLDVAGTLRTTGNTLLATTSPNEVIIGGTADAGDHTLQVIGNLRTTTGAILAATTGNVGIGGAPATKFHVYGGTTLGGATLLNSSAASGSFLYMGYGGGNRSYWGSAAGFDAGSNDEYLIGNVTNNPFSIYTNAIRRITTSGGGDVGIGTTSPSERLHVNGKVRIATIDSSASPMNMLWSDVDGVIRKAPVASGGITGSGTTNYIPKFTGSTVLGNSTIFDDGEVKINTVADSGNYKLQVNGDIYSNYGNYIRGNPADKTRAISIAGEPFSVSIWLEEVGASAGAPDLFFRSARGSVANKANVQVGDNLGGYNWAGYVDGQYLSAVDFSTTVVNVDTVNNRADTDLLIFQSYNSALTENVRIKANGGGMYIRGDLEVDKIDSTANAINMLYADANGVIKKTAVPASSVTMSTDEMTAASGWTIAYDKTQAYPINDVNKTVDGSIATVTINTAAYRTTATFNTDQWVHVATVPSGFRPNSDVYFSLPNTVAGGSFRSTSSVGFTSYNFYQEETAIRVLPSGNVEVYVGLVSNSADLSGANYVIMPIAVTYNIETYPN